MTLFTRIRNLLRGTPPAPPSAPSTLRNKRGGMAWIKPYGHAHGAQVLAGQIVKTVELVEGRWWRLDPAPQYTLTADLLHDGTLYRAGSVVTIGGLADHVLEPIRDVGDDERDESAMWLPPVKTVNPQEVKA